jgi:8-oxo-dGTP diphosphatase
MKQKPALTQVVAALIWREGKVLICQRPSHKARALLWEFPGGKVEMGESHQQALIRECEEELGVRLQVGALYTQVSHEYPDIHVRLSLYHARVLGGSLQRLEHAAFAWEKPENLMAYNFCPADTDIISTMAKGVKAPDFEGGTA